VTALKLGRVGFEAIRRWMANRKQPVTFNEAEVMWVMSDTAGMKGPWAGKGFMPYHVQLECR